MHLLLMLLHLRRKGMVMNLQRRCRRAALQMVLLLLLRRRGMTRMGMHSRMMLGVRVLLLQVEVRMGVRVVGMVLGRGHMLRRLLLLMLRRRRWMLVKVLQLLLLLKMLLLLLLLLMLLLKLLLVLFGESRIGQLFPGGGPGQDRFFIGRADVVHGALKFDNRTAKNENDDATVLSVADSSAKIFAYTSGTSSELSISF